MVSFYRLSAWVLVLLGVAGLAHAQPKSQILPPARDTRAVDSLRRVLAQHPRDTNGTKALVTLMFNFQYNDTAQAGSYGRQAARLATALGDRKRLARVSYNLAILAAQGGHNEESVRLHLLSGREFAALGNSLWVGHNYANAAKRRIGQGRFAEAMRLSLRGLRLRQAAHDTPSVADSYGTIGQIYLEQQNLPAAQTAYEQSLRGWQLARVPPYVVHCLNHLAIIHRDAGHFARARAYVAEGLAVVRAQPDTTANDGLLLTLAVLEQYQGHWAASLPLLRRVEAAYNRRPAGTLTPGARADLYSILGESLVQTGQAAAAAPYLTQALALARAARDRQEEADALEGLADLAAARADYRAAFAYRRDMGLVRDTLRLAATTRTVAELQTQYETERKDAQNRVQAAQLRTQQQVIRRRSVQLWAGLAIAALAAGVGYLLLSRRHLRREVEFAAEREALQQRRATAVLEAEEAERRRIGADLHDGVGQLLSVVKLNVHALGEELAPRLSPDEQRRFGDALGLVDESVGEVRDISHNLLPNALIKRGLARAVREFLDKVQQPGRLRIHLETLGLDDTRLASNTESTLYRVVQEAVQNIVKHARASEINLQLIRHAHELTLLVEDDGAGFDPAALGEGAGLGLRNMASRVAYLGGVLDVDSRPGRGTTVTATVPLPG
ncbi:tetratricopeptide repeat-containing sensor histidine kinase [Hymenobacter ruricola]|uniref:Oxygen sensor histidine kinase NreB n=1 Tax=Hymenobacter ruricola TaxID=2791023 RepID=A0ABS0I9G7_9BACT|nr:sensor histidine kinase [Hymenobacter ruricola]MBF9223552.1 sensor histidine kinase [Hymenobacter ruricola]